MMNISEEEQKEFSEQRIKNENKSKGTSSINQQMIIEMSEAEEIIEQAKERMKQGK